MKNFLLLILLMLLFSCDEFQTTQKEINLCLEKQSIPADGISIVELSVDLKRILSSTQEITFYTTEGHLFASPNSDLNVTGTKELTIKPSTTLNNNDKHTIKAYLRSDLEPIENVIVSAEINGLYSQKSLSFERNPISSMIIKIDKDSLMLSQIDKINVEVILLSLNGLPSTGGLLDQQINLDTISTNQEIVFYDQKLLINNDTLKTLLTPRVLSFTDSTTKEISATIVVSDASTGLVAEERIRIYTQ